MRFAILAAAAFMATTNVWALEDDESYTNYEAIVDELSASVDYSPPPPQENWDDVAVQGGMAFVATYLQVRGDVGGGSFTSSGLLTGVEGHLGSGLFSKKVRGEIAFRSYAPKDLGTAEVDIKELESRVALIPSLNDKTKIRMGFGLAARYTGVKFRFGDVASEQSATNLATSVFLGLERKLSKAITIGPDLAYRSTLSSSALDKSAWDTAIRLNATF